MARLNKFPVTTPEGIRYRVTIIEKEGDIDSGMENYAKVRIYKERPGRKFFRFKWLTTVRLLNGNGYNDAAPDFVATTIAAITRYHNHIAQKEDVKWQRNEVAAQKQRQITKFNEWDGGL